MKRTGLLWFFGAIALAAAAIGCGGDDQPVTVVTAASPPLSRAGESCTRTGDCEVGLSCVANYCVTQADATVDGGTPVTSGPVLGELGDSCTKRADCKVGLACIQQVCVESAPVSTEGGTPIGPRLGDRGESCMVVADCTAGLTCIPQMVGFGSGICDVASYGLTPTNKECTGECKDKAECCELPIGLGYASCDDIVATIGNVSTGCTAPVGILLQTPCFYYATYCNCAADTWACTNNRCVYTAACQNNGAVPGGCPSRTRSAGAPNLLSTCTTNKCGVAASVCTTATDCTTVTPIVDGAGDLCSANECTCYQNACYRACARDIDCPQFYTCDATSKVCVPGARCSTDPECAKTTGDVKAKCNTTTGTCDVPCTNDHECDQSGAGTTSFGAMGGKVCSATTHTCQAIGCSSDTECSVAVGGANLKMFCVDAAAPGAGAAVSAITD